MIRPLLARRVVRRKSTFPSGDGILLGERRRRVVDDLMGFLADNKSKGVDTNDGRKGGWT
jgi:hypothetical protein